MIDCETRLVTRVTLVRRIPVPPPPARRGRGRPRTDPDHLFLQALVSMMVRWRHPVHARCRVLEQPTAALHTWRDLLTVDGGFPARRPGRGGVWHQQERAAGTVPHPDAGVEGRRILHERRSCAIEHLHEPCKGLFEAHAQVPTQGWVNTRRFALGAVLVDHLT